MRSAKRPWQVEYKGFIRTYGSQRAALGAALESAFDDRIDAATPVSVRGPDASFSLERAEGFRCVVRRHKWGTNA